ncbi:hypothetical protein [Weissella cibaria]|uniref:hypothetical protein n=1 Tax=Weissella cibaria TaxID=137591 RepID=UPI00106EA887|nr:hypothetical protein [Weissella cibaria]MCQ9619250.1 hypothetical protein [Weissella cibaria]
MSLSPEFVRDHLDVIFTFAWIIVLSIVSIGIIASLIYYATGFRGGKVVLALKLRATLSSLAPASTDTTMLTLNQYVNHVVSRASIKIKNGHITIIVPVYRIFPFFINGAVKTMVRERLESPVFREFLENEFPGESFTQPINKGSYYLITND